MNLPANRAAVRASFLRLGIHDDRVSERLTSLV
jgi:hypothetical protein